MRDEIHQCKERMRGGTTQETKANQGNKRRPWMRLEVSGGGILIIGGVIIAAALAARRGHVNKQRNKRKTTPGSGYEQYHKEKEEEAKDGSIINGYGEITVADDLVEMKKAGSMTEIDEQLCLSQSHTEEREEWKEDAETVVGLDAYERVEMQDVRQEVGEEKVSACAVDEEKKKAKEDDACAGVGDGERDQISVNGHGQLFDEMLSVHARNQTVIHVEDDYQQVDEEERMESNTKFVANDEVLEERESSGEEAEPVIEELGKGEEEEKPSSSTYVVLSDEVEESECDCSEEGCNSKEEEEPATESYQEKTQPLAEKGEVQSNETSAEEGGSFFNNALTKDEEPDANIEEEEEEEEEEEGSEWNGRDEEYDNKEVEKQATESYEEETEPAVNIEEVQEDVECDAKEEPATEPCEEETGSSDGSGASSTENEDAVWPAEVLEHDETKAGQLATTMLNRQMMMMMMMMTMEKNKGKAFFNHMNHSLLVLAVALALALLSFHLSRLTVP